MERRCGWALLAILLVNGCSTGVDVAKKPAVPCASSNGCGANAMCDFTIDAGMLSGMCVCDPGYSGDGLTCTSRCVANGGMCMSSGDCCSLSCVNDVCGAQQECLAQSSACSSSGDCCSGLTCQSSTCQPEAPTCTAAGQECTASTTCCTGTSCVTADGGSTCEPPCGTAGEACDGTATCYTGLICDAAGDGGEVCGLPACTAEGQPCLPDMTDCCNGASCLYVTTGYFCTEPSACIPLSGACTNGQTGCCAGSCVFDTAAGGDYCEYPCRADGGVCGLAGTSCCAGSACMAVGDGGYLCE